MSRTKRIKKKMSQIRSNKQARCDNKANSVVESNDFDHSVDSGLDSSFQNLIIKNDKEIQTDIKTDDKEIQTDISLFYSKTSDEKSSSEYECM
jgi:hypothetical protein